MRSSSYRYTFSYNEQPSRASHVSFPMLHSCTCNKSFETANPQLKFTCFHILALWYSDRYFSYQLPNHNRVRHEAGEALGAIGNTECVAQLRKHQDDPCLEVVLLLSAHWTLPSAPCLSHLDVGKKPPKIIDCNERVLSPHKQDILPCQSIQCILCVQRWPDPCYHDLIRSPKHAN